MRYLSSLLITAVLALPAAAQQYISKEFIQDELARQKGAVLKYADAMPDSALGFRPTPGVRTFAEQIEHLLQPMTMMWPKVLGLQAAAPSCGEKTVYLASKAALKDCVTKSFDFAIGFMRDLPVASLSGEGEMMGMKMSKYKWVAGILDHTTWTLGQTVPYLRLNGVTPPGYSPF